MSYNQFAGAVGGNGWSNNNGGSTGWGANNINNNNSGSGWGATQPAGGIDSNTGVDPWNSNKGGSQGGWGNHNTNINCQITLPRPDDIKNLPTLEELTIQVLRNKEAFRQALDAYNRGGFTSIEDAFVKVIGNTLATGLFSLIKPENVYSYAQSIANGTEISDIKAATLSNLYSTLNENDKKTYDLIQKFCDHIYKTSGENKLDIRNNKSRNKKVFVQAFSKYLISEGGKKVIENLEPSIYTLDKVWEIYKMI